MADIPTINLDAGSDSPAAARVNLLAAVQRINVMYGTGAVSDGVTVDTATIQAALTGRAEIRLERGDSVVGALTVPAAVRQIVGSARLLANANNITVMQVLNDTTRQHGKLIEGLEVNGNGKTGVTGLRFGAVTNNPSAGAQEAVLYSALNNATVRNCDTGVRHDVTMEHTSANLVLVANTVGMKMYGDAVNGGGNANTWVGLRLNSNQVGAMVAANASFPLHDNQIYGSTIQENTLCGLYLHGFNASGNITSFTVDGCHFESNGLGTPASATIDGLTVLKSQMHVDNYASVVLSNSSLNTAVTPGIVLRNNATLHAHNVTGYGNQSGIVFDVDSTSKVYESGACIGSGIKYIESYGRFDTAAGPSICTVIGAPIVEFGAYPNSSPLASNVVPTINNVITATAGTATDPTFGEVSTVTFAASAGSTGTNRNYWAGAAGSTGDYAILSVLVKSSVTGSFTFRFTDSTKIANVSTTLAAGQWRRVLNVMQLSTGTPLQVFIYPNDTAGATLSFKGFENHNTTDLSVINDIYQFGRVGDGGTGVRTIASAGTLTLTPVPSGPYASFIVSGTTTITSMFATGWAGKSVTLIFQGALTVVDGSNLKLNGNFVTTADDTLTLTSDGVNWYETGRSAN